MADKEAVRICSKIYMEAYTSLLSLGLDPWALAYLELSLAPMLHPGEAVRQGSNSGRLGDGEGVCRPGAA
ncbi:hypothetical protein C2845_PM05G20610 [Panicum miliaceum]|uniref:Uncharacterized protein n=1 Tax=Panicum miliaceum TaxID=4540 RepID=A0A3L6SZL7_PANMI|nr:hypothetical protein C2845_PM05G20610 [Panicum miliaceum]